MLGDFFSAVGDVLSNESTYSGGFRLAAVLAFVAAGEWIAERAGTLNISVEAMLLGGAFNSAYGYHLTESVVPDIVSVFIGMVFGAVAGLGIAIVQANMSHRLSADQFVVGLTLNILVLGIASFLNSSINLSTMRAPVIEVHWLVDIPLVGPALFGQRLPFYFVYLVVPVCALILYRTRWGLEVRAVGENPQAADVSGVPVLARRRQAIYVAGITSGIGGAYLLLGQVGRFEDTIAGGQGFIAIAAVIFGGWTLRGAMLGCLLFGLVNSFRLTLPGLGYQVNSELLSSLPFVVTILAVAVIASRARQPAALTRPFVRGLN